MVFMIWMIAMQLWHQREDVVDPLREDEETHAVVVALPVMPKEPRALVA